MTERGYVPQGMEYMMLRNHPSLNWGHGVGVITLHLQPQLEEVTSSILVVSKLLSF